MKMKYIMARVNEVDSTPIIFPEYVGHDDIVRMMNLKEVTSAGFIFTDIVDGEPVVKCNGESVSLKLKSKETDAKKINRYFRGY